MQILDWPQEAPVGFVLTVAVLLLIVWMVERIVRRDPEKERYVVAIWGREVLLRSGLVLFSLSIVPRKILDLFVVRRPP